MDAQRTVRAVCYLLCVASAGAFAQGQIFWTKTFDGAAQQKLMCTDVTADGGFVLAGTRDVGATGGQNIWIIKTDSKGTMEWSRTYGGNGRDEATYVRQTVDGGYIIAGWTDSLDRDRRGILLMRIDQWGDTLWARTFGGTLPKYASVRETPDGGFVCVSTLTFAPPVYDNVYLIRTDAAGKELWTRHWDVKSNDDRGADVELTDDSGFMVTGHSYYTGSGNILDFTLFKFDSAGTKLWTRTYGVRADQRSGCIRKTKDGGYIMAGYTATFPSVQPDIFLVKIKANGDTLWTSIIAGAGWEEASWINQTKDGGYIIGGRGNAFGSGNYDLWLVRTDHLGKPIWTLTMPGPGDDNAYTVHQTADGGFVSGVVFGKPTGDWALGIIRFLDKLPDGFKTAPVITSITDIPGDQGSYVRVTWQRSSLDGRYVDGLATESYSVWRKINPSPSAGRASTAVGEGNSELPSDRPSASLPKGMANLLLAAILPDGQWDYLNSVPAVGSIAYSAVAQTLADSTISGGARWTTFCVVAHTTDLYTAFASAPDSGYSLDNLAPGAPSGVAADVSGKAVAVRWKRSTESDFRYFAVARGTQTGFDPSASPAIHTTADTFFVDSGVSLGIRYYYRIAAVDYSGNRSKWSSEASALVTGVSEESMLPEEFELLQNFPNPFNPSTTIRYGLPQKSSVELAVFNTLSQQVATLVQGEQEAGYHEVKFDASNLSSGIYFYRLTAGAFVQTRKLLLLR